MLIATEMLGSAECATLRRLVRTRFAAFAAAGLLGVPDARLAADRFIAPTFGVALDRFGSAHAARDSRVRPLVGEGVRTLLRAYRAE
ncbi:TetR/AcrR family transcriptional regulator C-terminal domain-containing protein [Streptomyces luteogriseus]|uniref:TetR/AcrR family transcriptional regulator C-terminal domain-containing protein n=1 Tax=Streptomyces luteogriseus TaxID=68233 RepID=UPI0036E434FE